MLGRFPLTLATLASLGAACSGPVTPVATSDSGENGGDGGDGGDGDTDDTGSATDTGRSGCPDMEETFAELVAFMEEELTANAVPGAALAIVCDGELAYSHAWGVTDHRSDEPITSTTRFQIASSTKMFTAATAMSLVDDGVVALAEPLSTYVPYVNVSEPYKEAITLHQLLSHSAGYPTTFSGGSFASYDLDQFFANNAEQPLWSPPGAVYNYSNLGMALAGLALEEASGQSFADLVETRVFEPAGMAGASMHAAAVEEAGEFAFGHSGSAGSPTITAPTDSYYATGYYGPMGGAWASVEDLARWAEVHLQDGGEVLSAASMEALRTPQIETRKTPAQSYGYGLFIDQLYGFDLLNHDGSVGGYLTSWKMVPEAGFGVFAVTNCDWYYPSTLTGEALGRFVNLPQVDMTPYQSSATDWPAFEGTYVDPMTFGSIRIWQQAGALLARFEDQDFTTTLTGYYGDTYYLYYEPSGTWLFLTFWRDEEDGHAQYLVTLYGVATLTSTPG